MHLPVNARKGLSAALISTVEAVIPAAVVSLNLFVLATLLNVDFNQFYVALAAVSILLSLLLLRPPQDGSIEFMSGRLALAMSILFRWMLLLAVLLALGYITKFSQEFARRAILPWALLTPVFVWGALIVFRAIRQQSFRPTKNVGSAVIAGLNSSGRALAEQIADHPELGVRVEGFFDDRSRDRLGRVDESLSRLGGLKDMACYVREYNIDVVFLTLPLREIKRMTDEIDNLTNTTASIYFVPDIFVFDLVQSRTAMFKGIPIIALCETPLHGYRGALKRALDVALTLGILFVVSPVMLLIAAAIKLTSPGPIIFRQTRYGLGEQKILVYKFRSMTVTEDGPVIRQAQKDDDRVTAVGRFLRKYSLDELPQLFNVLEGTMSLVGPRPHAVAHNEQYRQLIRGYMIRHKVLPGITGLAQVNGCRGETEKLEQMQERVRYDLDYLRSWSPLLDIKIIIQTIIGLFRNNERAY